MYFRYIRQHRRGLRALWQHICLGPLGHTLPITALQTKVTTGRLLLISLENHQEQICCLSYCAWLVWVFSMVQWVPTAGRCPKCLPHRSFATNSCTLSMFQSLSMLWPVFLKNLLGKESSDQWQEKSFTSLLHFLPLIYMNCQDVKMTTTLWERFNILIFPDSGLCNDLELLEKGTPSKMQWYRVCVCVCVCASQASKHQKTLELLKHAQRASHYAC